MLLKKAKKIVKSQWSKGIRQWPINQCTSPMMIHKIRLEIEMLKYKT